MSPHVVDRRGEFELSTDPARLDRALVHRFLCDQSYWASGVPREIVDRAIEHSLCFGVYRDGAQAAFARVVSDRRPSPIWPTCSCCPNGAPTDLGNG